MIEYNHFLLLNSGSFNFNLIQAMTEEFRISCLIKLYNFIIKTFILVISNTHHIILVAIMTLRQFAKLFLPSPMILLKHLSSMIHFSLCFRSELKIVFIMFSTVNSYGTQSTASTRSILTSHPHDDRFLSEHKRWSTVFVGNYTCNLEESDRIWHSKQ